MINEFPLFNLAKSFENDLRSCALDINAAVTKVKSAVDGEQFQLQAFRGGNEFFNSEQEIKKHYSAIRAEARTKGEEALERLLAKFDSTMTAYFRLDSSVLESINVKLNLASLSEDDVKRIAKSGNSDYSTLCAIASYGLNTGSVFGKILHTRLRDFELIANSVKEKSEKYIRKAFAGDSVCITGWSEWTANAIEKVNDSYNRLQNAIEGNDSLSLFESIAAR